MRNVVIILVITVLFYAGILFYSDFQLIIQEVNKINFIYFTIIFPLLGIQILSNSLKFHRLLQKLQLNIPFKESVKIFLGGFAMGLTPGGAGTIIKSYLLKKAYNKSVLSSIPVIIFERATELLSILIIMTFLLIWVDFIEVKIILGIGYGVFVFLMTIITNNKIFSLFKGFISKIKFTKRIAENLDESKNSVMILIRPSNFMEALGFSIVTRVAQLFIVYFVFLSVGINLDFFSSGQIYYTSLLIGVLTLIPAGIVVTESSMIGLLLKENIELPVATLGVLLVRFVTIWIVFGIGGIILKFLIKEKKIFDD